MMQIFRGAAQSIAAQVNAVYTALAAATGSGLIGFLQAGVGAVARTLQARLRDVVSVKDFGALGDGATDDLAAFNAAIAAVAGGGTVLVPAGTFMLSNTLKVKNKIRLVGQGRSATILKAMAAFPITTPVVRLGDGTSIVFDCSVSDLSIDANEIAGSTCLYSSEAQEMCGAARVLVSGFRAYGVNFTLTGGGVGQFLEDMEVYPSATGSIAGIRVDGSDFVKLERITINGHAGFPHPKGVHVTSSLFGMENIHVEGMTDGIYLGINASGWINGASGPSLNADTTNVVRLDGNTANVVVTAIAKSSAAVTVKDDLTGATLTDAFVRFYAPRDISIGGSLLSVGSNTPEGAKTAAIGSFFGRNNTNGFGAYVKETGTGNTGWRQIATFIPQGSAVYDPPSIAAGASVTTTVAVAGCGFGDFVDASFDKNLAGIRLHAYVSAADTVTVEFYNPTAGAIDLASGTLRARVSKAQ